MEWRLRQAGIEDAERLALIGGATFLETFAGLLEGDAIVAHCAAEHGAETYRALLGHPDSAAWVAEARTGGAPLGYALVASPKLVQAEPGDIELKRIYSFSRTHGTGLGAALMGRSTAHAEAMGAKRLLLGVFVGNVRALAFYRRHGFEKIGERRFRVGSQDCEDVVLAKPLVGEGR
ncbi:GNAT family N-acetyltransferase [Sphingomonas chungangi]|uniref:GNAT family N-acetyltransferase n=1 Tax=Sphingomonas chungangi TaxID=2683589 RepID=UPI0031B5F03C